MVVVGPAGSSAVRAHAMRARRMCFIAESHANFGEVQIFRRSVQGGSGRNMSLGALSAAMIMQSFSIETTPKLSSRIEKHSAFMPPGTPVYVAAIPGTAFEDAAELCTRLSSEGLLPVPHLAARAMRDRQELDAWLENMRSSGVQRVLLLAGDTGTPAGDFSSSLDVLRTGRLQAYGISQVDIVAHPEGSPHIKDALAEVFKKVNWAQEHNVSMQIVTQVCFDIGAISALCRKLRAGGAQNRIRVGLPGLASAETLLRYAKMCGVGPSLNLLKANASFVLGPAGFGGIGGNNPAPLLQRLSDAVAADPQGHGDVSAHFFSFGSLQRTAIWAAEQSLANAEAHTLDAGAPMSGGGRGGRGHDETSGRG